MTKEEFRQFIENSTYPYKILEAADTCRYLRIHAAQVESFDPKLAQLMRVNVQSIEDIYAHLKTKTEGR